MENIIVYFDDADHLRRQLAPMQARDPGAAAPSAPTHWVLVACAPRMTQHIGKWVSNSARQAWRRKWTDKLFALVVPELEAAGDRVTRVIAKGQLPVLTQKLMAQHSAQRVLDARRPKFGHSMPPVVEGQPARDDGRWEVPGAIVGMGTLLLIVD